jgi:hypothetical protein
MNRVLKKKTRAQLNERIHGLEIALDSMENNLRKTQDRLDWHETGPLGGFSKNVCLDMIEHLKKQLGESDSAIESWKRFLRLRGITWVEGGK